MIAYFDLPDKSAVGLDPNRLVELACAVGADAIGLRAAGASAWYRTAVPHHHSVLSDGAPDFLREFIERAREQELKVVAGVDFGAADVMTLRLRPEWFVRDDHGQVRELADGRYHVCPLAGFRGESVAVPVMLRV